MLKRLGPYISPKTGQMPVTWSVTPQTLTGPTVPSRPLLDLLTELYFSVASNAFRG